MLKIIFSSFTAMHVESRYNYLKIRIKYIIHKIRITLFYFVHVEDNIILLCMLKIVANEDNIIFNMHSSERR